MSSYADGASGNSAVDLMFHTLLFHWEGAKETTLRLQKCLTVTSGRESRAKGGWQYSPNFVVDSVLFADLLRHLQERSDVMTQAVHLILCLIQFKVTCFISYFKFHSIVVAPQFFNGTW